MIRQQREGGVVELCLDAAPCNEIGLEMLGALEERLAELRDGDARGLILYSGNPRGFSAGANLRELHAGLCERREEQHAPALRSFIDRIHAVMDGLDQLPIPTIGVIHGVCFGGGFELALTCDVLIAERSARFCFPELRLGIVPCFGGIPRLKRELGNAAIRDLLLTGRSINARKAAALGLVSQVVAVDGGLASARRMAAQMVRHDAVAVAAAKSFTKPLPRAELDREKELFLELAQRPQLRAALGAFVEDSSLRPYLA
jgi:enoyl-CoA hydratase/carnithine racemase